MPGGSTPGRLMTYTFLLKTVGSLSMSNELFVKSNQKDLRFRTHDCPSKSEFRKVFICYSNGWSLTVRKKLNKNIPYYIQPRLSVELLSTWALVVLGIKQKRKFYIKFTFFYSFAYYYYNVLAEITNRTYIVFKWWVLGLQTFPRTRFCF